MFNPVNTKIKVSESHFIRYNNFSIIYIQIKVYGIYYEKCSRLGW